MINMNDELYYFGSTLNFDGTDSNKFVESTPSVIYGTDENGNQTELTLGENLQILDSQLNVVGVIGGVIDDNNVSTGTTYSSAKIEDLISGDSNGIPLIDKTSDTSTTFDIEPNKMYMFGERTTLTINLLPGESGIVNEYMFQFTSGNVATTLNVPNTVVWLKDPDIQTNKKYAVSIENNLGIIGEWSNE